ncbi:MAG: hypothetical protein GPJ54_13915 [Candidatus Heimdallarchaeota archaeon]|nr:hypothetical protein [Candidatus Heimdallarchaeota archaeon]
MMLKNINRKKFLKGIKYGAIIEIVLIAIFTIFYLSLLKEEGLYPYLVFTLFSGGLLFIISGFIGPGRYHHNYKLFIFSPKVGASYFENVPLSSVCTEGINNADIYVNGKIVGEIDFKNQLSQIVIKRDLVDDIGLNKMWLQSKNDKFLSNLVSFTFFDFDETMSTEQVDEFSSFDNQMNSFALKQLNEDFQKKITSHMGSLSLGLFITGAFVMAIGFIFENILI